MVVILPLSLCLAILLRISTLGYVYTQETFQCQSSGVSSEEGQVLTPSIPDLYFNQDNAADLLTGNPANLTVSRRSNIYMFTIPSLSAERNCSGTVQAINYCYLTRHSVPLFDGANVFILYHLTPSGREFTISTTLLYVKYSPGSDTTCSSPIASLDGEQVCCNTQILNVNQRFRIPKTDYSLGVEMRFSSLLAFADSAVEYQYEQYQLAVEPVLVNGDVISVANESSSNLPLLLLRFIIEPDAVSTTDAPTEEATPTGDNNSNDIIAGAVGGAIGGVIVALLLAAVIILCVVVLPHKRQSKKMYKIEENNGHSRDAGGGVPMESNAAYSTSIKMAASISVKANTASPPTQSTDMESYYENPVPSTSNRPQAQLPTATTVVEYYDYVL